MKHRAVWLGSAGRAARSRWRGSGSAVAAVWAGAVGNGTNGLQQRMPQPAGTAHTTASSRHSACPSRQPAQHPLQVARVSPHLARCRRTSRSCACTPCSSSHRCCTSLWWPRRGTGPRHLRTDLPSWRLSPSQSLAPSGRTCRWPCSVTASS